MTDDKYRDQLAEALCRWWDDENGGDDFGHRGVEFPCQHCRGEAAALSPVVAQIRADAQTEVAAAVEAAIEDATQVAFNDIALEKMLTIQPIGRDRAVVPPHWRDESEARAKVPTHDLRAVLAPYRTQEQP